MRKTPPTSDSETVVGKTSSYTIVVVEKPMDLLKEYFEQLKSEDSPLAFMFQLENVFEAGPQLILKVFILTREKDPCKSIIHNMSSPSVSLCIILHIVSTRGDGWMMIGGVVIGIASCAWRVVCTRKNRNLVRENEKNMCTEHVILFFGGYFFLIGMFLSILTITKIDKKMYYYYIYILIIDYQVVGSHYLE